LLGPTEKAARARDLVREAGPNGELRLDDELAAGCEIRGPGIFVADVLRRVGGLARLRGMLFR